MTLSDISIRNPVFAWMLMFALIIFGGITFSRMGVSLTPDVDQPFVTIQLKYEGASPEVMELDVVDIIEDAVTSVQGIKNITSVSKNEMATVTLEFELNRNIDVALQEVQTKIAQAQPRLPIGMDLATVTKNNAEDQPILWVAMSGNLPKRDVMEYARDHIKDQLQTIDGVSEIILGGYIAPTLRVWVDPEKLKQYELTVQDVQDAIKKEHVEIPAGRVETKQKEYDLRFMGETESPEDFANILIQKRGDGGPIYQPIRVGDVAHIEKGLDDIRRISRTNLQPAIGLGIRKQRGSNSVQVAHAVKAKLDVIRKTLPKELSLQVNYDGTKFIEQSTSELNFTLILSAILTGFVCLMFLGSLRAAFNILMAIPTSIMGTFLVMYFMGFTLNTFSLLGLLLAIGIVVDDAIMVLENIVRQQEEGKSRFKAALEGAREITPAAVAATISIVAIFAPVIFMQGIIGKFLYQFGVTMSAAVMLSLLEALTLTPMRCSRFVNAAAKEGALARVVNRVFGGFAGFYEKSLTACLKHRWGVSFCALVFFMSSFALLPHIKKELLPSQDQSSFMINVKTPLGSSIDYTDGRVKEVEKIIMTHPEIERYYTAVGGFSGGEITSAIFFITMKDLSDRPKDPKTGWHITQTDSINSLRAQLAPDRFAWLTPAELAKITNLTVSIQDLSLSSFSPRSYPVEFSIRGPDWDKLATVSQQFRKKMEESKVFSDLDTDYKFGVPEIQIVPNRQAAAERGVSMESIGRTVDALIGGTRVGKFSEHGHRNDIRLRVKPDQVQPDDVTKGVFVRNYRGELIALKDVVETRELKTLQSITRQNRERAVSFFGNPGRGYSLDEALNKVSDIAKDSLPEGYHVVFSGSAKVFKDTFANMIFVLGLGVVVAYMVLGSQYNSFVHPFVVLLALPFSLSGAWIALFVTGKSLNLYSFIGLILLMGIVKKNSILLVDFTNQRRRAGLSVREALLAACPKRLRPILMTSFATIAAAIPAALALGPGAESHIPMAIVVIGGVFVSTLLTLYVVPCAYSLMSWMEGREHAEELAV